MTADLDTGTVSWRKSRRSVQGDNNCVEVSVRPTLILLRDSKDPSGVILQFSPHSWNAFIAGVRAGEFDGSSLRCCLARYSDMKDNDTAPPAGTTTRIGE